MARKTTEGSKSSQRAKSSTAQAATVHRLPAAGRRRAAPEPVPVLFPNVATIVGKSARAAVAVDPENRITHWNKAAVEAFGFTDDEVLGRNLQQVIQARDVHGNRLPTNHSALHEMIAIGEAPHSFELAIITATGKMIRVAVSLIVVLGPQPRDYAIVYLMTVLHRRRRADEAIDRLLAQVNIPGVTVPGTSAPSGAEQRGSRQPPNLTRRQLDGRDRPRASRLRRGHARERGGAIPAVRAAAADPAAPWTQAASWTCSSRCGDAGAGSGGDVQFLWRRRQGHGDQSRADGYPV
mgnify:CR=1 FL=1